MEEWKKRFQQRQEMVLVSASEDGKPHAIYVISLGLMDDKLLIGVCLMKKTLENIKNNNQVVLMGKIGDKHYRVVGKTEVFDSGKYLEASKSKSNPPLPHKALLISINELYDLDNSKRLI
jgi:uncharacterized pyridoxamine 5'-phosphate oxidase family protein